jgi:predicted RNA-binding Zn ribbon-like protein
MNDGVNPDHEHVAQRQMSKTSPSQIPHGLDAVIDYVNTCDLEDGEEELRTPAELASWLASRGLLAPGSDASAKDLAAAIELREALRALMLANNGAPPDPGAWETLEHAARAGELALHFGAGEVRARPAAAGASGALARLLVPVAEALADRTWLRVKACHADDCSWAFYDRSRNRSATWCEMSVCGNRTKVRAYRHRAAGAAS